MAYSKTDPMSTVLKVIKTALASAETAHKRSQQRKSRNNNPEWAKNKEQAELYRIKHISENATTGKIPK
jgi:hypothetical protein